MPRSRAEVRRFTAVSFTAGFCEEFLYRGYFLWALTPFLGWWGAAALSVPLFGLAHAYQGWRGIVRTALVGAGFVAIVALLDSLWPAIVLHFLVDAFSGVMAWVVLQGMTEGAESPMT
jgi:membrane protease YdiL (CAAX protease family)